MRIFFKDKNPEEVVEQIKERLGGRKLGDMVSFDLQDENIQITIKKMGTSTLLFSHKIKDGGREWELSKEKIALTHRAFKDDMIEKLKKIIHQAGGQVYPS